MIVPDKKTEAYLNRRVRTKDVVRLCRAGVLRPTDFLKAVLLSRSDGEWRETGRRILSVLMFLSFSAAAFFLIVSRWHFFYTVQCGVFLALLFVAVSCVRRFAAADYGGAALIGAMIFLPDRISGADIFLYEQFFLWFFLSLLWALPTQRTALRVLPSVILNLALALYGVQFVIPFSLMTIDTYCVLAAGLNVLLLALREGSLERTSLFRSPAFRIAPLVSAGLFLSAGIAGQLYFKEGGVSFLYGFLFTLAGGVFYLFFRFDGAAFRLLLGFCAVWAGLLLYYVKQTLSLGQPLFLAAESLLIVVAVISDRRFGLLRKEEKNDY